MEYSDYKLLLEKFDDSKYWEYPPGFDYNDAVVRFKLFVAELVKTLGGPVVIETESLIQDASFHSQVHLSNAWLRFSNFGNMAALTDETSLPKGSLQKIKRLLESHGYIFMPSSLLEQPYYRKESRSYWYSELVDTVF